MSPLDRHVRDLRDATEPTPGRLARVRAERRPRSVVMPVTIGLAAVAAALVLVLLWPEPKAPPPPEAVAETWSGSSTEAQLGPHVAVVAEGHGQVAGDAQDMHLRWTSGTLAVEVAPGQGVGLRVETEEGVVVVHGTAFEVVRDALGTHVAVRRGEVGVTCTGDDTVHLGPDEELLCPPTTAVGWLRRVTRLQVDGAHEQVLDGVEAGLSASPAAPVDLDLRLHRARALQQLGRPQEAEAVLDDVLARHPEADARVGELRGAP